MKDLEVEPVTSLQSASPTTHAAANYAAAVPTFELAGQDTRLVASPQSERIHSSVLRRFGSGSHYSSTASQYMLQLQRQYGNRYVRRVIAAAGSAKGEQQVDPAEESAIERKRGGGAALHEGVRAHMESAFGSDFSGVRVHTDGEAASLNRAVSAVAFTTGKDIFFSPGAYNPESSSGRELLAHELTHVVQQAGNPVQPKLVLGEPEDQYEQEAEAVGKQIGAVARRVPTIQRSPSPAPVPFVPALRAVPSAAHINVGDNLEIEFRVENYAHAPAGTKFTWADIGDIGLTGSDSNPVSLMDFKALGTKGLLQVKGRAVGVVDLDSYVRVETPDGRQNVADTPHVHIQVGSDMAVARGELAHIEDLHSQGKPVEGERETAAQSEAATVAQQSVSAMRPTKGAPVVGILGRIGSDIDRIEWARALGYVEAVGDLNLAQLDEQEQAGAAKSFALSLLGNLVWALSGLIAITPIGFEARIVANLMAKLGPNLGEDAARALASRLVPILTRNRALLSAAVGTGGAMLAQFSSGLPAPDSPGGNVSGPIIALKKALSQINSDVHDTTVRSLYSTLLATIDEKPPLVPGEDADQFAGRLEMLVRNVLFAGYYENGAASENQIHADEIQTDARNQLLRRLIVTSGKISGQDVATTQLNEHGPGKLVPAATSLIGGPKALQLVDYELVTEQLLVAAREFALRIHPEVSADLLSQHFGSGLTRVPFQAQVVDSGALLWNHRDGKVCSPRV